MKEHPILFSTEMVIAILEGRKTQTRRVVKPQPDKHSGHAYRVDTDRYLTPSFLDEIPDPACFFVECPYGLPGDRLWVRETWANAPRGFIYKADFWPVPWADSVIDIPTGQTIPLIWKPSIHMPRIASRILLEVVSVWVEQVQDISEGDIIAEGCPSDYLLGINWFRPLWDSINEKRGYGWNINPYVWVVEFKRVKG